MNQEEMLVIQNYLRKKLGTDRIVVKEGDGLDAPAEVLVGEEYIGAVYKNDDEEDVSYDVMISILQEDLE